MQGIATHLANGDADHVVGASFIAAVGHLADTPLARAPFAVVKGEILVQRQLGPVPDADDINDELSFDGTEPVFIQTPCAGLAGKILFKDKALLRLCEIVRFHRTTPSH